MTNHVPIRAAADADWHAEPSPTSANAVVSLVPPPPARRIRLRTIDEITVEARRVYRSMRLNEIDSQTSSRLIHVLTSLAKLTEAAALESRLSALEERARVLR